MVRLIVEQFGFGRTDRSLRGGCLDLERGMPAAVVPVVYEISPNKCLRDGAKVCTLIIDEIKSNARGPARSREFAEESTNGAEVSLLFFHDGLGGPVIHSGEGVRGRFDNLVVETTSPHGRRG